MPGKIQLTDKEKDVYKQVVLTAHQQLEKIGKVMPEGLGALKKHPGMNPMGYYSEIDMGFAERMKRCENAVRLKDVLVWTEYTNLKKRILEHPEYARMKKDMIIASKEMRVVDRALRLCKDDNVRKALEEKKEALNNSPILKEYDTLMKTFEAYSGVKLVYREMEKMDKERAKYGYGLRQFCSDKFGIDVGACLAYDPYRQTNRFVNPKSLEIEFENIEEIMQCHRMVSDQNMGKSWEEVKNTPLEKSATQSYASSVPAYMQASCDRVLDSALPDVKDRADYILINGVSVREQMKTQEGIEDPSEEQIKKYSSLYVAAALRQGLYVETFTKDITIDGTFINYKPVPIVAKGENSPILKQKGDNELENITIGFLDRILAKLGFSKYKDKVEKANALVDKVKQGREAFRNAHTPKKESDRIRLKDQTMKNPATKEDVKIKKDTFNVLQKHKDDFLAFRKDILSYSAKREHLFNQFFPNGTKPITNEATGIEVKIVREGIFTLAVVNMLNHGYSLEEALDTSKNANVREKMAEDICEKLRTCDERTFFEKHLEVTDILGKHLEKFAKENNVSFANPSSVFKEGVLFELALGAGNVPDIIMQDRHKETVEKYFGKGIVEKTDKITEALIVNGKAAEDRGKLGANYKALANGEYPSVFDFMHSMQCAITYRIFAKLEQQTGKVFSHPITSHEMVQIENMVLSHPNVEKFYKETPPDKLVDIMTQEKLLEAMNIDFEILPTKLVPGKHLECEEFSSMVALGTAMPTNFLPTFNGKGDFYNMVTEEKANQMAKEAMEREMKNGGMGL